MKRFDTHIILVSDQMTPNAIPVMDEAIRPQKVILCVTDAMKKKAEFLIDFFKQKNIDNETFELGTAYDFATLKDRFLDLAIALDHDHKNIALNLTGGTKLMTIAALLSFEKDYTCFYVIPEEAKICMVNRNEEIYAIQEQMKLEDFFAIHGYKVKGIERKKNVSHESRDLFDELLNNYHAFKKAIGTLNYLSKTAEINKSMTIKNHNIPQKSWDLLLCFQNHGAIKYYDDRKIEFKDKLGRQFCQGFWLEDYTYLELAKVKEQLQDYACSISIESPSGIRNEIDVAFLRHNRLHLIECKTANLQKKSNTIYKPDNAPSTSERNPDKESDAIYKLDSIHSLPGIYTRPFLISYLPLGPFNKKRADELNIKVLEGQELKNLAPRLL